MSKAKFFEAYDNSDLTILREYVHKKVMPLNEFTNLIDQTRDPQIREVLFEMVASAYNPPSLFKLYVDLCTESEAKVMFDSNINFFSENNLKYVIEKGRICIVLIITKVHSYSGIVNILDEYEFQNNSKNPTDRFILAVYENNLARVKKYINKVDVSVLNNFATQYSYRNGQFDILKELLNCGSYNQSVDDYYLIQKAIQNKRYSIVVRLIQHDNVEVSEIKNYLDLGTVEYLIDNNCIDEVDKLLIHKSKRIYKLFKKMDEILIEKMNDVTYYVADLDIINDDNYYKRISFDKAIKERDFKKLRKFKDCPDFLEINDLCDYLMNVDEDEDMTQFIIDKIIVQYDSSEFHKVIFDHDDFDDILPILFKDINDCKDLLDESNNSGTTDSIISYMKDEFIIDDLKKIARDNDLWEVFEFDEECADCESCETCEECKDCGRRHMDS